MSALLLFKLLRNRNISSNLGSRGLSLLWSLCLHSMGLFRDCETSRKFVSTSTHSPSPLDTALILSPCLTSQPRHYFMWTLRNSIHYDVIYRFIVTQRKNKLELDSTTIEVWTTSLASYYCICIVVVVLAAAWLMAASRLSHYTARKRNSIVFVPVTRVIGPPTQNKTIQLSLRTLGASKTLWWRSPTFLAYLLQLPSVETATNKGEKAEKTSFLSSTSPPLLPTSLQSPHSTILIKVKNADWPSSHYASWLSKIDDVLMQILLHKRNTILQDKQGAAAGWVSSREPQQQQGQYKES